MWRTRRLTKGILRTRFYEIVAHTGRRFDVIAFFEVWTYLIDMWFMYLFDILGANNMKMRVWFAILDQQLLVAAYRSIRSGHSRSGRTRLIKVFVTAYTTVHRKEK